MFRSVPRRSSNATTSTEPVRDAKYNKVLAKNSASRGTALFDGAVMGLLLVTAETLNEKSGGFFSRTAEAFAREYGAKNGVFCDAGFRMLRKLPCSRVRDQGVEEGTREALQNSKRG